LQRPNGECFKCGEKYDPTHQCAKKPVAELHALTKESTPEQLSEEVLNMMELHDIAEAQQLSLSINAMPDGSDTICNFGRSNYCGQTLVTA
jgi:N-dimethylarginine dimethylaminohydrolase